MSLGAGNSFEAGERFGRGDEGCDQERVSGSRFIQHPAQLRPSSSRNREGQWTRLDTLLLDSAGFRNLEYNADTSSFHSSIL